MEPNTADEMVDSSGGAWRRSYGNPIPLPVNRWPSNQSASMAGMHALDLRIFQTDECDDSYSTTSGTMLSPHLGYKYDADWQSEFGMRTPSTAGFSMADTFSTLPTSITERNFAAPNPRDLGPDCSHSPSSSFGSTSPEQRFTRLGETERPSFFRAITAPEPRPRKGVSVTSFPMSMKRSGSEEDDNEYVPGEETKPRSRKRQRIPHTAVERRYREALNAGIKSLQRAVAESKRASGASTPLGDDKPSKSFILNGAINHIETLSKENFALQNEVKALRSRLHDVESWCAGLQTAGYEKY